MEKEGERVSGDLRGRVPADEEDEDGGSRETLDRGPVIPEEDRISEAVALKKSYTKAVGNASWPTIDSLPDPIQARNIRRIVIPQQDYEAKRQNFRFALIGRVNFHLISLDALHEEARANCKLNQEVVMNPLGKGYVIFEFKCEGVGRPVAFDKHTRQGLMGYFARIQVEIDVSETTVRVKEVQIERLELATNLVLKFRQKVVYEDNVERCGYCKRVGHLIAACR
ncbi:uncharacterized protein LOC122066345 [Macadamia integrifolia]|uniref:uncharacterized protein LOC122066345 n=1 Tax=Macadamia integrifolia TaxID=60698 RepID=UPI001C5007D0|nr:uncharacterized protein LOC122066345 [Macadamia integrifolia]